MSSNAESPKVLVVVDPAPSRVGTVVADLLRRDPAGFEVLVLGAEEARPRPELAALAASAARIRLASFTRSFVEAGCPRFDVDAARRRVELVLIIAALARP